MTGNYNCLINEGALTFSYAGGQQMRRTNQRFKRNVKGFIVGIALMVMGILFVPQLSMSSEAASDAAKAAVKEELKEMILTADDSQHDILKYKLIWSELEEIWNELEAGECYDALNCHDFCVLQTKKSSNYISTIYLYMKSASSFEQNFATFNSKTNEILSGLQSDMTDLDKALYIHDEIVDCTTYSDIGYASYKACGPLVYGKAVCEGYSRAYIYLLNKAGIKTDRAVSDNMNHTWVYVCLDGNYYHVDLTWDDTRASGSSLNGAFDHKYFLRTDGEIKSLNHYGFYAVSDKNLTSTDTTYSNSFIHSVAGRLYFYNGYWYYADGSSIKCAQLTDSAGNTVVTADGNIQIVSVKDGIISYKVGSTEYTYSLVMGANEQTQEAVVEEQTQEANVEEQTLNTDTNSSDATTETTAMYYLVVEGGSRTNYKSSNYISLGTGTIKEAVKIQNDSDAIEANLGTVPDYSSYVTDDNYIEWYSIKKEGDGWHVDGQIMVKETTTDESTVTDSPEDISDSSEDVADTENTETVDNTSTTSDNSSSASDTSEATTNSSSSSNTTTDNTTTTGITAHFYLAKNSRTNYSSSNYISLGDGTIKEAIRIKDNEDAILAILLEIPDYSKYVKDGYHVEWYSVKKEGDGWHVDGQIMEDVVVEEEETEEVVEEEIVEEEVAVESVVSEIDISECTEASFYLAKGSRTNYSSSNYISLGKGYIIEAVKIQNDEEAIVANLAVIPDYSEYLTEGQKVEWYSIKKEGDGWHVDGQIVSE